MREADDPARSVILIDLGGVLREEGRFDEAHAALGEAMRLADARADAGLYARARVERLLALLQVDPPAVARQAARHGAAIARALEDADDRAGRARLWHLRGLLAWIQAQAGDAADCWRLSAADAGVVGDERMLADVLGWEATAVTHGPTPVDEAFARCDEIRSQLHGDPWAEALVRQQIAALHAMRGEFEPAFALLDESEAVLAGFSPTVDAAVSNAEVFVSLLAPDPVRAERHLRAGRRQLEAMGERAVLASTEGLLALVVLAQGRTAEADRLARHAARITTDDDISAQVLWRRVRAAVLAQSGRCADAERLAREGVVLAERTDCLNDRAAAVEDLARVHEIAGHSAAACAAWEEALEVYRRKGNAVCCVRLEQTLTGHAHV